MRPGGRGSVFWLKKHSFLLACLSKLALCVPLTPRQPFSACSGLFAGCLRGLAGVRTSRPKMLNIPCKPCKALLLAFWPLVSSQSSAGNCCRLWTLPVSRKKSVAGYPNGIFPPYNPPICLYLPVVVCFCCFQSLIR